MLVSIIVPVYNEAQIVAETIAQLKKLSTMLPCDAEIIVVDDASTDGSSEIIKKITGIQYIQHKVNHGYGSALKRGFDAACGDYFLITDADGTYPLEEIPTLVELVADYDMVIGQRAIRHDKLMRTFAKFILRIFAFFLTGRWIPDLNSGLRIFDRKLAERFGHLFPARFSLTTTLTLAALTQEYDVLFHPIKYHQRVGQSGIRPWAFIQFSALLVRIVMYFRPLRFFVGPGILLLLAGVVQAGYQIYDTQGIGETPVILLVGGLQFCFLGLLADLIVKSRSRH